MADPEEERALADIEAEFAAAGYALDLEEMPDGSWSVVYQHRLTLSGSRIPQGAGKTKLDAARMALVDLRATSGTGPSAASDPTAG
jgi:hypothetical protein